MAPDKFTSIKVIFYDKFNNEMCNFEVKGPCHDHFLRKLNFSIYKLNYDI
jgi:hypothetical protein